MLSGLIYTIYGYRSDTKVVIPREWYQWYRCLIYYEQVNNNADNT